MTPAELYQQEKARAKEQGKPVLRRYEELSWKPTMKPGVGEATVEQIEKARSQLELETERSRGRRVRDAANEAAD